MSRLTATDEQRLARAAVLMDRYTFEISRLVEGVLGPDLSGNHEVQVLTRLFTAGSCRPPELAQLTRLSRAGVARLVERLERAQLVRRNPGAIDRRTVLVSLTRSGRQKIAGLDGSVERHFRASAPMVEELCDLLHDTPPMLPKGFRTESAIDVIGRMGAVGAPYAAELDREVGITGRRSRAALSALFAWGEARPGHLADVVGLSSGGLTYLIDQLENDGIVERRYGSLAEDRRAVVLALTERGRAVGRAAAVVLGRHADALCAVLALSLQPRLDS